MLDAYGLAAAQLSEWRRQQAPADPARRYEEFLANYEPGPITRMVEWLQAKARPSGDEALFGLDQPPRQSPLCHKALNPSR